MTPLTVADIESGYAHDCGECEGWLGFGYLGGRRDVLAAVNHEPGYGDWSVGERGRDDVAAADAAVVAEANRLGWGPEELFRWANSRDGRHFADTALEGPDGLARAIAEWFGTGRAGYVLGRSFSR